MGVRVGLKLHIYFGCFGSLVNFLRIHDDDGDCCFMATFVHMVGQMGQANSKSNEAKSKMKHPSDTPTLRFELKNTQLK